MSPDYKNKIKKWTQEKDLEIQNKHDNSEDCKMSKENSEESKMSIEDNNENTLVDQVLEQSNE